MTSGLHVSNHMVQVDKTNLAPIMRQAEAEVSESWIPNSATEFSK